MEEEGVEWLELSGASGEVVKDGRAETGPHRGASQPSSAWPFSMPGELLQGLKQRNKSGELHTLGSLGELLLQYTSHAGAAQISFFCQLWQPSKWFPPS